ncbi:hypothetical protein EOD23_25675 [Mesorhizobium sp. USDA-HM6]|nr:hypothetical protein EOD23_25675 [Mesorhizobium sp. USDA-HM6]
MARTPAERSGHRQDQSPSPEDRATGGCISVTLTASAKHYASKQAITGQVETLDLGSDCAVGDLVSLETAGIRHDFAVIRRRWIIGARGGTILELTLDYPARSI